MRGPATEQCWDSQTYSNTLSQSVEVVSCLPGAYSTSATPWSEMANQNAIGYNSSNVMLVHNENPTDMSLVAMLASCSTVPHQVLSVGGGLEDSLTSCGQRLFFSPTFEASAEERDEDDNGDDCSQPVEKKRRLSFNQVKSLEKSFELENKLDPERKLQLAKDLGLQPRQVSVWFQNRRARWKTKKLEGDFEVLTADYNSLKRDLEAMLDENKQLKIEVKSLTSTKLQTSQTSHKVDPPKVENLKSKPALTPPCEESEKLKPAPPELNNASSESGSQLVQALMEEGSGEVSNQEAFSSGSVSSQILNIDSPYNGSLVVPPENITHSQVSLEMNSNFIHLNDNPFDQMLSPAHQSNSFKPEDGSNEDNDASSFLLAPLEDGKVLPWWEWA